MAAKSLIIRFSSFGDIVQCLHSAYALKAQYPDIQIHWAVRSDMAELLTLSPYIDRVWSFDRSEGMKGLVRFARELNREKFDYLYDAHNNVRSHVLSGLISAPKRARRPKSRWMRFLEFKMGMPQFNQPFQGAQSFVLPLEDWGVRLPKTQDKWLHVDNEKIEHVANKFDLPNRYVTFAPSAAWQMKRWPVAHWKKLISSWTETPIVLLGGKEDHFISELHSRADVINLAGKTNLMESAYVIAGSQQVVSADTGLLHVADGLAVPTIALIGPTAFGFPSHPNSTTLEVDLSCRPCSKDGRGHCKQSVYQRCMVDISPERVLEVMK